MRGSGIQEQLVLLPTLRILQACFGMAACYNDLIAL
jgi:hypothetical protein